MQGLLELYCAFFRVGAVTFGGGYAMLPIIQREVVERKKWATEEEMADILARGEDVDRCIRLGQDRTEADREFHAAIVRATHNSFMMRLLPMINQAVAAAIASGQHKDQLAEDTRKDHALLMDFFRKRDAAGAGHAMAIHMHHSIDVMGLGTQ